MERDIEPVHIWKVRTLEDRDLEGTQRWCTLLVHIWDKELYLGHRTGAHKGAVYT